MEKIKILHYISCGLPRAFAHKYLGLNYATVAIYSNRYNKDFWYILKWRQYKDLRNKDLLKHDCSLLGFSRTSVLKSSFLVQILCTSRKSKTKKQKNKTWISSTPTHLTYTFTIRWWYQKYIPCKEDLEEVYLTWLHSPDANVRGVSSELLKLQSRRHCSVTVAHAEQLLDESSHNSLKLLVLNKPVTGSEFRPRLVFCYGVNYEIIRKQYSLERKASRTIP